MQANQEIGQFYLSLVTHSAVRKTLAAAAAEMRLNSRPTDAVLDRNDHFVVDTERSGRFTTAIDVK